jgi:hypothetical protein
MTPQEQELINGSFDRLSQLESQPRDPEAERLIAQGLAGAPHAIYALVQTVLVQDEALRLANARIEELQAQTSATAAGTAAGKFPRQHAGGFQRPRAARLGAERTYGGRQSAAGPAAAGPAAAGPAAAAGISGCSRLWLGRIVSRHRSLNRRWRHRRLTVA